MKHLLSIPSLLLLPSLAVVATLTYGATPCLAQSASDDPSVEVMSSTPPPKALPSEPGWGYLPNDPKAWMNWHQGLVQRSQKGGVDVVFIGDSLTYGWIKTGKATWDKEFEPLHAVDYGIGGDTTRQLLWRINHGTLDGITPKLVVLMIGTNNLYNDHNSGTNEQIAEGVKKIVALLQAKVAGAKILLLGVLPRQNEYFCDRIARLNLLIAPNASGDHIRYLDPSGGFTVSEGKVTPKFYEADQVHLTPQGYEHLAVTLKPVVAEMLK